MQSAKSQNITYLRSTVVAKKSIYFIFCKFYILRCVNRTKTKYIFLNFIRRVILIMDIEVTTPGSEVGYKIGNPTNIESKSETDNSTTSDTSIGQTTSTGRHQTSNYIIILSIIFQRNSL